MKRAIAGTLASSVATIGLLALVPTSAMAAGNCRTAESISIRGGEAEVQECTTPTQVQVRGWVRDTLADGKCAQVYATYNRYSGRDYSSGACPKGDIDSFVFPWRAGSDAFIYLRVY
ncbi:hypothetical protein I6A60_37030 [Frankia sp. AgB1.9]|uniref:hypothetical protein n=1 Tax=unclassified Frankia TaxID=2632575 RepID=UPI0019348775|nr:MULTISPECIES: hypothetical protein [unclassified Frankia]MBL7493989.1 hypothetical protein [Frankia sp. AgW1.1]MBL7553412.1 hypothetical protein [Frankia sp. AgB1.9]MBL7622303.1 hypothetical protein [Frankia sp. AgB1.8]